jgi:hypothetical protein
MDKLSVDAFTFETISPSLMRVTWTGHASAESMRAMREYSVRHRELSGTSRCIVDATEATGFERGARKELHELGREKPWERVAFVGVSFEIKVLLELLTKALQLMRIETSPVIFVDTEAEAMAWLTDEQPHSRDVG